MTTTYAPHAHGVVRRWLATREVAVIALLVLVVVYSGARVPRFSSPLTLPFLVLDVAPILLIALPMTLVIVCGEIDLSVGSGVALAGCILGWVCGALTDSVGAAAAVAVGSLAALLVGAGCGVFTGKMRQWFNVPSFITTLALFAALRGFANLLTGGFPLTTFPGWFDFFGAGSVLGIPFPVFVFATVFAVMHFLMKYTAFGRAVYAVGGNAEASRLSGIDVFGVKTAALAITGGLAAISGLLIASQIGSGNGTAATGMELDVIAATIIGGTSLFGGKGRVWGTLLGVLFLGCLSNGMTLMNVSEYWQYVTRGATIMAAVLLNQLLER
jgi:sugar transport system permease protein